MKKTSIVTMLVASAGFAAGAANALPLLNGSISLNSLPTPGQGPFIAVNGSVNGGQQVPLGSATGLDFTNTGSLTPGVAGPFQVGAASGDFLTLGYLADFGEIKDFSFAGPGSANYPTVPITSFEIIDASATGNDAMADLAFDLLTVTVDEQTNADLVLRGEGIFRVDGYADTEGTWVFTGNFQGNNQGGTFSFSVSQATIPEPGSLALVGLGLAALGVRSRRRRA